MDQLTKAIYVASKSVEVQKMLAINNLEDRRAEGNRLSATGVVINQDVDIMGADPVQWMESHLAEGWTSYPSVKEGNPFNGTIDPTDSSKLIPPAAALPGQPGIPGTNLSYKAYIAANGPFDILVSVDAADYPANPEQYVPTMGIREYQKLVQTLANIAVNSVDNRFVPLTQSDLILLPSETDADDVDFDENHFPLLRSYRAIANDPEQLAQTRFAVVLNMGGGAKVYGARELADALASGGPDGVLKLGR